MYFKIKLLCSGEFRISVDKFISRRIKSTNGTKHKVYTYTIETYTQQIHR